VRLLLLAKKKEPHANDDPEGVVVIVAVRVLQAKRRLWKWFVVLAQVQRALLLLRLLLLKFLPHHLLKQAKPSLRLLLLRLPIKERLIRILLVPIQHQHLRPHQTFVTFLFQEEME
jgi:hypothetical protein